MTGLPASAALFRRHGQQPTDRSPSSIATSFCSFASQAKNLQLQPIDPVTLVAPLCSSSCVRPRVDFRSFFNQKVELALCLAALGLLIISSCPPSDWYIALLGSDGPPYQLRSDWVW